LRLTLKSGLSSTIKTNNQSSPLRRQGSSFLNIRRKNKLDPCLRRDDDISV
jgi:hypothetical protein